MSPDLVSLVAGVLAGMAVVVAVVRLARADANIDAPEISDKRERLEITEIRDAGTVAVYYDAAKDLFEIEHRSHDGTVDDYETVEIDEPEEGEETTAAERVQYAHDLARDLAFDMVRALREDQDLAYRGDA
jgi:hypothetical protein